MKENRIKVYWQGDIPIIQIDKLPDGPATKVEDGVIARGEVTGHPHAIRSGGAAMLYIIAGQMYIHALRAVEIDHNEHGTIILPMGVFKINREREYTPEGLRTVRD